MTKAKSDKGQEIYPDQQSVIHNKIELAKYLKEIYKSRKEYVAAKYLKQ